MLSMLFSYSVFSDPAVTDVWNSVFYEVLHNMPYKTNKDTPPILNALANICWIFNEKIEMVHNGGGGIQMKSCQSLVSRLYPINCKSHPCRSSVLTFACDIARTKAIQSEHEIMLLHYNVGKKKQIQLHNYVIGIHNILKVKSENM